jgi:EF-P beta-lysylation protein EpmB
MSSSAKIISVSIQSLSDKLPADDGAWKKELANATTSVSDLLERLQLSDHIQQMDCSPDFSCLVTDSYLKKMEVGNINDPLLLQVLPQGQEKSELHQQSGTTDPVADLDAMTSPGLLHKYHGRALLISTGACAIHCRYCFRRHYPYQQSSCVSSALDQTIHYLQQHTEIEEIILSGGDPLVLDNEKLNRLISTLETVPHIHTLRIHTRLPIVLHKRINAGLLQLLQATRFHVVMVIHANHANELGAEEQEKLLLLRNIGVTLLNQSVLLKGINDNADTLVALSKRLFSCYTLPYYLHLLDPVKGAMHFDIEKSTAIKLKDEMEQRLSGYLIPRLVQEIAGKAAKTAIFHI